MVNPETYGTARSKMPRHGARVVIIERGHSYDANTCLEWRWSVDLLMGLLMDLWICRGQSARPAFNAASRVGTRQQGRGFGAQPATLSTSRRTLFSTTPSLTMADSSYDLIIIGGGSGGSSTAKRAAECVHSTDSDTMLRFPLFWGVDVCHI